jgi:nucleoside-diphosphate-sugar epimerase
VPTKLLILGGSRFVGRTLLEDAVARGWEVTAFNRGGLPEADGVRHVQGDRLRAATLAPLAEQRWALVSDTWAGAPRAVRDSAALLSERADRYAYISTSSVYTPPPKMGADESAGTVDAAPDADDGEYPNNKRGAELAVLDAFGDRALLARAGLILGPYENVGRLPWWLNRIAAGGEVLAPGPPDLPLQFVDARDLARFVLDAALAGHSGAFNVVSRRGHATMSSLLEECVATTASDAQLQWVDSHAILAAGVEPWTELPIWLPPEHDYAALHGIDVSKAHRAGLRTRPVAATVEDTWTWMRTFAGRPLPQRADLPPVGLDRRRERALLAG